MSKSAACSFLRNNNDFLLIAHVSPDGDTLGSCLCLYDVLLQMGKRVQVACEESVPVLYTFLPHAQAVLSPLEVKPFSAIIFVDCGGLNRAGELAPLLEQAEHSLCIDHHQTNLGFAQENWVLNCSSTGEMVFSLLQELDTSFFNRDTATCLYTAIATDTGNFAYSNVASDTFLAAASLVQCGIDLPELNRRLFRCTPVKKARLVGVVMQNLQLLAEGRFALSTISCAELDRWNASGEDCEGLIDRLRDIEGVEVSCLLRDSKDGSKIRVSLRSLNEPDVSQIAARFGGGGHKRAAGCTLSGTLEEARDQLKEAILSRLYP